MTSEPRAASAEVSMHEYVRCLNDPFGNLERIAKTFSRDHNACFVLCNAGTKVSEHEGISAAGIDPLARRLTPALDAEALLLGRTISADRLPVSPLGIVSPVVISRACLRLLNMDISVIDCGSFHGAASGSVQLSELVADCVSTGQALPYQHVQYLYKRGLELGAELAASRSHLVIAECVPGGTTTALAVLTALGFDVRNLLSSSLPICNHSQRFDLVRSGLDRANLSAEEYKLQPLRSVAAVGDPMQAVVAGLTLGACTKIPVFLAGGSQMLAVWTLLRALASAADMKALEGNVIVMTTKWVAHDPAAGVQLLAKMLSAPFAAASPNFHASTKAGLRAYEEGHVKEGVGAGASMCLTRTAGFTAARIMEEIDFCYDELMASSDILA